MDERLTRLEAAVDGMASAVARLDERIAVLEHGKLEIRDLALVSPESEPELSLMSEFRGPMAAVIGTPTLIGRSLLVLAGAFLLRALTEGGSFAPTVGVAVGVAYAAVWIVASALAARRGARASAGFYAACSAVIVGPLLFEASTSFGVLSPAVSVVALAAMTGGGLLVAHRWQLQSTAWIFSLGGLATAVAMATVQPPGEVATAFLVMLGLAIFWLADEHDWDFLNWVTALAADLAVLRLTAIATASGARPDAFDPIHPSFVAVVQVFLVVGFVGTVVFRALQGRRPLRVFDFVQTAGVWIVGWGGAVHLARTRGWGIAALSVVAVAAGLAAYFAAFGVVDRRQGRNRAFLYLSSLGLGLVLIGLPGVIGDASAAVWSVAAVMVAAAGSRWDRVTLRVHAAVLLAAAWVSSGVVSGVLAGFSGGSGNAWTPSPGVVLVAILTIVTTTVVLVGRGLRFDGWAQRLPLTTMLAMTGIALASTITLLVGTLLGRGTAMVTGTIALSAVSVALALMASQGKVAEAGWLVYPFLVVTGLRMIAVDLSSGNTLVLVFALTAYGAALIVSTRLIRGAQSHLFHES